MGNKQQKKDCQSNQEYITDITDLQKSSLSSHTKLKIDFKKKIFSENNIQDEQILKLSQALSNCTNLSILELDIWQRNKQNEALKNKIYIYNITRNNTITARGLQDLGNALMSCSKISNLNINLSYNPIGDQGILALGQALVKLTNLSILNLDLFCVNIWDQGVQVLISDISKCVQLQTLKLDMFYDNIENEGALGLAKGLESCLKLSNLDLEVGLASATQSQKRLRSKNNNPCNSNADCRFGQRCIEPKSGFKFCVGIV
ncbi:hypothetical protein ABPG74_006622 [Tetrahymena malaccensis]